MNHTITMAFFESLNAFYGYIQQSIFIFDKKQVAAAKQVSVPSF